MNPELEAIEVHFLKCILNLSQSTTNMAVHWELLRRERILCYWNRLCSCRGDSSPSQRGLSSKLPGYQWQKSYLIRLVCYLHSLLRVMDEE